MYKNTFFLYIFHLKKGYLTYVGWFKYKTVLRTT